MSPLYHSVQHIPTEPGIYKIICKPTGRFYVGSAVNLRHRWISHLSDLNHNKHRNPKLQNAFNKHGESAFLFEILEIVLIPDLLTMREQYWFDKLNPFGRRGFNIARVASSSLGLKRSPEAIEKNRRGHLGQIAWNRGKKASPATIERLRRARVGKPGSMLGRKHSPATREKLRVSHLGQPGYWTGKKRPPETGKKIGDALRGKPSPRRPGYTHSPEHRQKIRLANLGKTYGESTKLKLSAMRKGKKKSPASIEKTRLANLGRKNTPEAIAGMIAAKVKDMKTLIVTSPEGTEYVATGIRQFCKEHSLDRSCLMRVAKGKCRQYKGWKARFPEADTEVS